MITASHIVTLVQEMTMNIGHSTIWKYFKLIFISIMKASSSLFYDIGKMACNLIIFSRWCLLLFIAPVHNFKKVKNHKLISSGPLINYSIGKLKTTSKSCKRFLKNITHANLLCQTIQKIYSKMYSALCPNAHHDIKTFRVDRMIENIKKLNISRVEHSYSLKWKNT